MTVIFKDTFTDSNGTLLTAHTPDIPVGTNKWLSVSGVFSITGNQAYLSTHVGDNMTVYDTGVSDGDVQVTIAVTGSVTRVFVRSSSNGQNCFMIQPTTGGYEMYKRTAGSWGLVGTTSGITSTNGDVIKFTLSGSSIKLLVNGVEKLNPTDTFNQTATYHGIGSDNFNSRWDDFTVSTASAGGTDATVTAVTATATSTALAPSVTAQRNVSITAPVATVSAQAIAPSVSVTSNATVTSVTATSTISAIAPTISTTRNVTIAAVSATMVTAAYAPVAGSVTQVNAVVATMATQAIAPTVAAQRQVSISIVVASINASANAPRIGDSIWQMATEGSTAWQDESQPSTLWANNSATSTNWR
jgi:hypothetical protein